MAVWYVLIFPEVSKYEADEKICIVTTFEKSVGTTELHYSTKKLEHSLSILKAFFVRHLSEYETSDNNRKVNRNI